jgi:hypothetical protein
MKRVGVKMEELSEKRNDEEDDEVEVADLLVRKFVVKERMVLKIYIYCDTFLLEIFLRRICDRKYDDKRFTNLLF